MIRITGLYVLQFLVVCKVLYIDFNNIIAWLYLPVHIKCLYYVQCVHISLLFAITRLSIVPCPSHDSLYNVH